MAVGVFVIVALWKVAQLPAEALVTGVVPARWAVAITPPIAKGFGNPFEFVVVGKNRTTFAHSDVMGRIEAEGANVAKRTDQFAIVSGTKRIAAIFDQPEIVFLCDTSDFGEVIGIAQRVGEHDGLGFGAYGGFELADVDVVGRDIDIDKDGDSAKLQDGINGGREAGGDANDFIPRLDGSCAEFWAG